MFIAAPIERKSRKVIGAPAKTDFVKIYICDDVSRDEYDVLLKHEQSHIWLEHNKRNKKEYDHTFWTQACELEVARNIYKKSDIEIITRPFSRIPGGVLPDSCEGLPFDLLIAEDIYDWLLANKPKAADPCKCCEFNISDIIDNDATDTEKYDVDTLIKDVLESLEKEVAERKSSESVCAQIEVIKNRPPSLTEEIDASLRYRIERQSSYRRPRRGVDDDVDLMRKGRISIPRPPLVEIYVDRSGSFTLEKTKAAQNKLDSLLKRYGASIKYDVWFFGGGKISANDFSGGDTPYNLVAEHINKTQPKIAVIVTDDDMCGELMRCPKETKALVIPIACSKTIFSEKYGAKEVTT